MERGLASVSIDVLHVLIASITNLMAINRLLTIALVISYEQLSQLFLIIVTLIMYKPFFLSCNLTYLHIFSIATIHGDTFNKPTLLHKVTLLRTVFRGSEYYFQGTYIAIIIISLNQIKS